jgi:hypothetical protein
MGRTLRSNVRTYQVPKVSYTYSLNLFAVYSLVLTIFPTSILPTTTDAMTTPCHPVYLGLPDRGSSRPRDLAFS